MHLCLFIKSVLISIANLSIVYPPKQKSASFRQSKKSPRKMDRLRKSFRDSFRRRKDRLPESSKPHQWQSDEQAVRSATCSFAVKYLGCVEVYESRGMQVCEEALKVLRVSSLKFHFPFVPLSKNIFLLEFPPPARTRFTARERGWTSRGRR